MAWPVAVLPPMTVPTVTPLKISLSLFPWKDGKTTTGQKCQGNYNMTMVSKWLLWNFNTIMAGQWLQLNINTIKAGQWHQWNFNILTAGQMESVEFYHNYGRAVVPVESQHNHRRTMAPVEFGTQLSPESSYHTQLWGVSSIATQSQNSQAVTSTEFYHNYSQE